jgi:hypothetical protein
MLLTKVTSKLPVRISAEAQVFHGRFFAVLPSPFSQTPFSIRYLLERGPLSLVSKIEELLGRKVMAPV